MPPRNTEAPSREQRHRRILAALATDPTVRISVLAAEFGVSSETVRRDIEALSRQGAVRRTYGGASVIHSGVQPAVGQRERIAVAERLRIGAAAAAMVPPGAVLMIDSGSTTAHVARSLSAAPEPPRGTVLTNSLVVAEVLGSVSGMRVLVCPGEFYQGERAVFGPDATTFLDRFNADIAMIGASGLTAEGPNDIESQAGWIKRAMLERAGRRVLLVDSGKFGKLHLERICGLGALTDVVTDAPPPADLDAALTRAGVRVTIAPATANDL
jgi:DeoR family transcriptional regulator, glycerol-3-phosphate regulon repressor